MYKRFIHNHPSLKPRRQQLRNDATECELLVWNKLKKGQIGFKFRRQYSFSSYIIDFYCPQMKLAVEIDGPIHEKQVNQDEYRTKTLNSYHIKVIRFNNIDVKMNVDKVIEKIRMTIKSLIDSNTI